MKNKGIIHILAIISVLAIYSCAGEGSSNDNAVATTESSKMPKDIPIEILTALETPNTELTKEQLDAFELRAIQKFEDFTDYLEIISDKDVDSSLINHSIIQVEKLFINDSVTIPFSDDILEYEVLDKNPILLIDHIKIIPKLYHPIELHIKTKSIEFTNPLSSNIKNNGVMKVILKINGKKWVKNVDAHLVEIQKEFGDDTQAIMQVRLGNIY